MIMNAKSFFLAAALGLTLTGCGIFNKYENKTQAPSDAFGVLADGTAVCDTTAADSTVLARMSWREFFTDPALVRLIDRVLAQNTDLNSARLAVEKSEAALKMAKMAYAPSLSIGPQATVSSFALSPVEFGYNLPLQLSLELDFFGNITNKKNAANAVLLHSKVREESVKANLISTTAQQYYLLQVLDRQLEILTRTDSLWNVSLETQRALWENGKSYSTAVNQMEASYLNVKTQIVDTRRKIVATENAICRLLAVTPQHIDRSAWGTSSFDSDILKVGVPASMLELRPDIRMANFAMEEAFYNTQAARSAFYPRITLGGTAGWTNSLGGMIVNPAGLLLSLVGQLTQPIFAQGKLSANLKIAKLTEQDLQKQYVQTVINAGNQVNEAIADCQASREKNGYYQRQLAVLHDAYIGTHELMDNGKASYLEVLTAQESLLSAQLGEAMNLYEGSQALIALYIALGGATK